jgi:mono/diheme cytochrome c family protein
MKRYVAGGLGSLLMTFLVAALFALSTTPSHAADKNRASVDRGRYIVKIGGCNDCHTPGFAETNGQLDEQKWLTGDKLGWQGPWGTTFAINLRQFVGGMTEDQWVQVTRNSQAKPPMPTWVFRDLTETDLRSLYRYIRSLGVAGETAPTYVPPGQVTKFPTVKFPQPSN